MEQIQTDLTKIDNVVELFGIGSADGFEYGGAIDQFCFSRTFGSVSFNVTDQKDPTRTINVVFGPEQFGKFAAIIEYINQTLKSEFATSIIAKRQEFPGVCLFSVLVNLGTFR